MIKRILLSIVVILLVIIIGVVCFWSFIEAVEVNKAKSENEAYATIENIKEPINIAFLGDSLTAGFMGDTGALAGSDTGYRDNVEFELNRLGLLGESVNYAIGGYTTQDVLDQLSQDTSLYDVNKQMLIDGDYSDEAKSTYLVSDDTKNTTITSSIETSDVIIMTIGANDIIDNISFVDDQMVINFEGLFASVKSASENKKQIFDEIHAINPDAIILDVGIYFAYPHIGDDLVSKLYPILVLAEQKLFFDMPKENVHSVIIRDNMQVDIKNFVPNPDDIHPNTLGYDIMANEILKELDAAYK